MLSLCVVIIVIFSQVYACVRTHQIVYVKNKNKTKKKTEVPVMAQWLANPTSIHEEGHGFDPWPRSVGYGSSTALSCGIGRRRGSDPALLWLWCRLAATAPIRPLAWEPPCASGVALKRQEDQKRKQNKKP